MKKRVAIIFLIFLILTSSFSQNADYGNAVIKPKETLKNLMSFLNYQKDFVRLSEDFIPLDSALNIINADTFFELFATGKYLPLRRISKQNISCYQLYKFDSTINIDIRTTIKAWGVHEYKLYWMQGKELPEFNFTDLQGNVYNKEITKGKILVLKCWFIHCVSCIAEMPELNKLVKKYKKRQDIIFVSLAIDSSDKLKTFLSKTTFKYATIAAQEKYMVDDLKIDQYPTHLIINKQGLISKVVNSEAHLAAALKIEILKTPN